MSPEVKASLLGRNGAVVSSSGRSGRAYVVDMVRTWIFDGKLRDGDVLSQEDLAEVLGISRIPVRDGLIALESAGWVVIDPGVGARAVGLDSAAVSDSYELFGRIWELLIWRVVELNADCGEISDAAKAVGSAMDPARMTEANDRFVMALRRAANAPRLDAAFRNTGRIVPGDFFLTVPHAMKVQRQHVPGIASALRAGDAEAAAGLAMAQHASHARNIIVLLRSRGVLTDLVADRSVRAKSERSA